MHHNCDRICENQSKIIIMLIKISNNAEGSIHGFSLNTIVFLGACFLIDAKTFDWFSQSQFPW